MDQVVIVGAGHAGGTLAALLRQYGFAGSVTLLGEEAFAPYQRPPLSKAWLKGEAELDAVLLRADSFYADQGISLQTGVRAEAIDREGRRLILSEGRRLDYDALVLATGSVARRLAVRGAELEGCLYLRTLAEAEALKSRLRPGTRVAVVGGGYVGLEVAASARALGCEAVVIEREARCLARVASPILSQVFEALHRDRGVSLLTEATVAGFDGEAGRLGAVSLADGRKIACDLAVIGIGGLAEDSLARQAGLACNDGILVDDQARTADPHIFAIGDATRRPVPVLDGLVTRLESVPNALEQAKQVAAALTGRPPPPPEVPWFWSDQYEAKLQIAGLLAGTDRQVIRGEPSPQGFAVFHFSGERLRAVEAVNAAPEFMMARQWIARATPLDLDRLADPATPIRSVVRG